MCTVCVSVCLCVCVSPVRVSCPDPGPQLGIFSQNSHLIGEHCRPEMHLQGSGARAFLGLSLLNPFPAQDDSQAGKHQHACSSSPQQQQQLFRCQSPQRSFAQRLVKTEPSLSLNDCYTSVLLTLDGLVHVPSACTWLQTERLLEGES